MKRFDAQKTAVERWVSIFVWLSIASVGVVMTPPLLLPTAAQIETQSDLRPDSQPAPSSDHLVSPSNIRDETIDTFVESMMAEKQIPGLSLAIVHDQKLLKVSSYGMLDREQNVKVRPSSIFPIASVSKPLTATAIMLLVEDGKVDLDVPISNYLSTYLAGSPPGWESITVRRLLNHTSGLSEDIYQGNLKALRELSGYVEVAGQLPLDFTPGESWMYSNTGYNVVAAIVEQVSGKSLEAFMQTRIFEPLGMSATDVIRDSYAFSNRAMGYEMGRQGGRRGVRPIDVNFELVPQSMALFKGSGSVTSNVLDLARWAIALQKGQLLSPDSQAEMEQFSTATLLPRGYGLGWFVGNFNGHKTVAHGGNLWGYSSAIAQFPNDNLTVIILTNLDEQNGEQLALEIAGQYLPDLIPNKDAPAISDPNPAFTSQLLSYLQGDEPAITRTSAAQIALENTTRGQYIADRWNTYRKKHSVVSLELIAQAPHPMGENLRYRATTENDTHLLTVISTPEGLVSGLLIDSDN